MTFLAIFISQITSSLSSLTISNSLFFPIYGVALELGINVPIDFTLVVQNVYSPITPAPALHIAFLTCSVWLSGIVTCIFTLLTSIFAL
mgnify:CR=1 FL=1